jgi:hypothetical protein
MTITDMNSKFFAPFQDILEIDTEYDNKQEQIVITIRSNYMTFDLTDGPFLILRRSHPDIPYNNGYIVNFDRDDGEIIENYTAPNGVNVTKHTGVHVYRFSVIAQFYPNSSTDFLIDVLDKYSYKMKSMDEKMDKLESRIGEIYRNTHKGDNYWD